MHRDDRGMVERGDMFWNRGRGSPWSGRLPRLLFGFGNSERFTPELFIEDGSDLSRHGFTRVRIESGFPAGTLKGIHRDRDRDGELFCGDLLVNEKKPVLNDRITDPAAARESVERLRTLGIRTVYPSHGRPFALKEFFSGVYTRRTMAI